MISQPFQSAASWDKNVREQKVAILYSCKFPIKWLWALRI